MNRMDYALQLADQWLPPLSKEAASRPVKDTLDQLIRNRRQRLCVLAGLEKMAAKNGLPETMAAAIVQRRLVQRSEMRIAQRIAELENGVDRAHPDLAKVARRVPRGLKSLAAAMSEGSPEDEEADPEPDLQAGFSPPGLEDGAEGDGAEDGEVGGAEGGVDDPDDINRAVFFANLEPQAYEEILNRVIGMINRRKLKYFQWLLGNRSADLTEVAHEVTNMAYLEAWPKVKEKFDLNFARGKANPWDAVGHYLNKAIENMVHQMSRERRRADERGGNVDPNDVDVWDTIWDDSSGPGADVALTNAPKRPDTNYDERQMLRDARPENRQILMRLLDEMGRKGDYDNFESVLQALEAETGTRWRQFHDQLMSDPAVMRWVTENELDEKGRARDVQKSRKLPSRSPLKKSPAPAPETTVAASLAARDELANALDAFLN